MLSRSETAFKKQQQNKPVFTVSIASNQNEREECYRLRYQVFAEELGATIHTSQAGLDIDGFDDYCTHLIVRHVDTNEVIATTRLLTSDGARQAGMFYSENEFELANILAMPGNILEIGRTCIADNFRTGAALNSLWHGIAKIMLAHEVDYLMGCASIPASDGGSYALSVMDFLRQSHMSSQDLRVSPYRELPNIPYSANVDVVLPRLLKTYLLCGAVVCGEPFWDTDFKVADVFIFVDRSKINKRFAKHFLGINA